MNSLPLNLTLDISSDIIGARDPQRIDDIRRMLTFAREPSVDEMVDQARKIVALAEADSPTSAVIGVPPAMYLPLDLALERAGIMPRAAIFDAEDDFCGLVDSVDAAPTIRIIRIGDVSDRAQAWVRHWQDVGADQNFSQALAIDIQSDAAAWDEIRRYRGDLANAIRTASGTGWQARPWARRLAA